MDYLNYHRDKTYLENEDLFKNIFLKRVSISSLYTVKKGRVLDVGTSTGVMLDLFRKKGWETWGVEPSKISTIAKKKGHKVINGYVEKVKLPKNYFDLVMMNHVLEHLDNPKMVLKKMNVILKKGGILYVDVPNAGGVSSKILKNKWPYKLPEEHKSQFTKKQLTELFKQCGFDVVGYFSRSGIFEFQHPIKEVFVSLLTLKKRFFKNLISLPYSLFATAINMGDSMSLIGKKHE